LANAVLMAHRINNPDLIPVANVEYSFSAILRKKSLNINPNTKHN